MTYDVYDTQDIERINKQLQKTLVPVYICLAIAVVMAALTLTFTSLPISRNQILLIVCTAVLGAVCIFWWDLKVRPVRSYRKFLREVEGGRTREGEGQVVSLSSDVSYKDGLYYYQLIINTDEKLDEEGERMYYYDASKARPVLSPGDWVNITAHGNYIMQLRVETGGKQGG